MAVVGGLLPIFVASGPLGTHGSLSQLQRLALWGLCAALDLPMCYSAGVLTLYFTRSLVRPLAMAALAGMSLVTAAPCTAVTVLAYQLFHGGSSPSDDLLSIYAVGLSTLVGITALLYYVVWLRVSGRYSTTDSRKESPEDRSTPASAVRQATRSEASQLLLDRLPAKLGDDIVCLRVSGHYLEVVTTSGSAVVIASLHEASAALSEIGMRIHRSYWVAYRHVTRLVRRKRRVFLCVSGDRELPVSSSYLAEVRAAFPHLFRPT